MESGVSDRRMDHLIDTIQLAKQLTVYQMNESHQRGPAPDLLKAVWAGLRAAESSVEAVIRVRRVNSVSNGSENTEQDLPPAVNPTTKSVIP